MTSSGTTPVYCLHRPGNGSSNSSFSNDAEVGRLPGFMSWVPFRCFLDHRRFTLVKFRELLKLQWGFVKVLEKVIVDKEYL